MKNSGLWFAKVIGFWMNLCPRWLQKAVAWTLGFLWWDLLRLRRFTIYRNLTIVFPDLSKEEKKRIARESLYWMGYNFLEFLKLPQLGPKSVRQRAVFNNIENYEAARAQGKGVYFLSLHLGNGDVGTAMMTMAGIPCHLISKKFKQKWLNDFWFGVREMKGTKFIDPHGRKTPFEILKAVNAGEVVIFVLDQFMGKPYGIDSTFFGRRTGTAYGLALFALKTGSPVVPVYTVTDKDGRLQIYFDRPIPQISEENRDLQIAQMTAEYNRALERIILRHPEQWMWVHRRWKTWE
ncbi:MAG: lysophospholipid acyltransferase family protein [Bdellovibrionaceae bacterium]|nr:lysophospholipid acyltransferase family protein [Pseudobdellovibrionaceae bacterium]